MSLKTLQRNFVPRSLVDEAFSFENKKSVYDIKYNGEQNALLQVRGTDPGGGGTPIYGLYRYVPRNRVWFLRFSVLK